MSRNSRSRIRRGFYEAVGVEVVGKAPVPARNVGVANLVGNVSHVVEGTGVSVENSHGISGFEGRDRVQLPAADGFAQETTRQASARQFVRPRRHKPMSVVRVRWAIGPFRMPLAADILDATFCALPEEGIHLLRPGVADQAG